MFVKARRTVISAALTVARSFLNDNPISRRSWLTSFTAFSSLSSMRYVNRRIVYDLFHFLLVQLRVHHKTVPCLQYKED